MKSGWQCGIHRHGIIQEQEDPILSPFLLSQVDDSQYHVPKYSEIIGSVLFTFNNVIFYNIKSDNI
jgi:hypothetical protein